MSLFPRKYPLNHRDPAANGAPIAGQSWAIGHQCAACDAYGLPHPANATYHNLSQAPLRNSAQSPVNIAEQDPSSAFLRGTQELVDKARRSGLELPSKPQFSERTRNFQKDSAKAKARALVVEGQDRSLEGAEGRSHSMASKVTAVTGDGIAGKPRKPSEISGYKKLTGNAKTTFNHFVERTFKSGEKPTQHRLLLNQQRQLIEQRIVSDSAKLIQFLQKFAGSNVHEQAHNADHAAVGLDPKVVADFLQNTLGLPAKGTDIRNTFQLKQYLENKGVLGEEVWQVASEALHWLSKSESTYAGIAKDQAFDHEKGGLTRVVEGARPEADLHKAIKLFTERKLDSFVQARIESSLQNKNVMAIRYSGNNFNVPGLYGAQNEGVDGAREANFRSMLRLTAKNIVVRQLIARATADRANIEPYLNKVSDELVLEFAKHLDPNFDDKQIDAPNKARAFLIRALLGDIDNCELNPELKLNPNADANQHALFLKYPAVIFGPCGTLQGALNHVGGVLTAVQHITGNTSLWSNHNGDFAEVSGLQSDSSLRTYMKLEKGTSMFNMYADHPELASQKNADGTTSYFVPIDCVHSQNYANVPGFEDEATAMLRTILSDIVPDVEHLKVRITGTSSLGQGADRPYTGDGLTGASRFAQYPHQYKVTGEGKASVGQEELIIEAVEFVFEKDGKADKLFVSTQNHDDAFKGNHNAIEFADDSTLYPYTQPKADDGERVLMKNVLAEVEELVNPTSKVGVTPYGNGAAIISATPKISIPTRGEQAAELAEKVVKWINDIPTNQAAGPSTQLSALTADNINAETARGLASRYGASSNEYRLFTLVFGKKNLNLSVAQGLSAAALTDIFKKESDVAILLGKFEETTKNIAKFLSVQKLLTSDGSGEGQTNQTRRQPTDVNQIPRPRGGWETNSRNEPGLPTGVSGSAAVPVAGGNALGAINAGVASAGLAAAASAGVGATGGLLMAQGALMEHTANQVARRLGKVSQANEARFNQLLNLVNQMRSDPTVSAARTAQIEPILGGLEGFNTAVNQLLNKVANTNFKSRQENGQLIPTTEEYRSNIQAALGKVQENLDLIGKLGARSVEISDLRAFEESLAITRSINDFINNDNFVENRRPEGPVASSAGDSTLLDWFTNKAKNATDNTSAHGLQKALDTLLSQVQFRTEADAMDELQSLFNMQRQIRWAEKDNRVFRWSGRGMGLSGAAFLAAATPLAGIVPGLGVIGAAVLGAVYGANYLNTKREMNTMAKTQLDLDAEHRQPWAPKVVGFHRELLARRAEQIEAARARKSFNPLNPLTYGWKTGLLALAGITTIGAVTVATGGIALPVGLAVGAALAIALSASGFNLMNRHAERSAMFGPRVESTAHLAGMNNSTERKKFYWSASKMASHVTEQ